MVIYNIVCVTVLTFYDFVIAWVFDESDMDIASVIVLFNLVMRITRSRFLIMYGPYKDICDCFFKWISNNNYVIGNSIAFEYACIGNRAWGSRCIRSTMRTTIDVSSRIRPTWGTYRFLATFHRCIDGCCVTYNTCIFGICIFRFQCCVFVSYWDIGPSIGYVLNQIS